MSVGAVLLTLIVALSAFDGLIVWATHRWVKWVHDRERGE